MSALDFVAFDVETANRNRASVCAVGVAVVKGGEVVNRCRWLAKPPEECGEFDPYISSIHGITPQMVANEPPAKTRIVEALELVGDQHLVAHNAAFDTGAIRGVFDVAGDTWPAFNYACTMVMARRVLNLVSYRLPIVCHELGVPVVGHHEADRDAEMCAQVLVALAERCEAETVEELMAGLDVTPGRMDASQWSGCVRKRSYWGDASLVAASPNPDADPSNPLYGQVVVFTGGLGHLTRQQAWDAVAERGATAGANVTKKTTLLVIGDGFTGDDPQEFTTRKAAKAVSLRAKGQEIEVVGERDFLELLEQDAAGGTRG